MTDAYDDDTPGYDDGNPSLGSIGMVYYFF